MKKRIVSFVMALVMALSLVPGTAFAVDETYTDVPDVVEQEAAEPVLLAAEARYAYTQCGKWICKGNLFPSILEKIIGS